MGSFLDKLRAATGLPDYRLEAGEFKQMAPEFAEDFARKLPDLSQFLDENPDNPRITFDPPTIGLFWELAAKGLDPQRVVRTVAANDIRLKIQDKKYSNEDLAATVAFMNSITGYVKAKKLGLGNEEVLNETHRVLYQELIYRPDVSIKNQQLRRNIRKERKRLVKESSSAFLQAMRKGVEFEGSNQCRDALTQYATANKLLETLSTIGKLRPGETHKSQETVRIAILRCRVQINQKLAKEAHANGDYATATDRYKDAHGDLFDLVQATKGEEKKGFMTELFSLRDYIEEFKLVRSPSSHNFLEDIPSLQKYLKGFRAYTNGYFYIGRYYAKEKKWGEAIQQYKKFYKKKKKKVSPEAHYYMAEAYDARSAQATNPKKREKDLKEARRHIRAALSGASTKADWEVQARKLWAKLLGKAPLGVIPPDLAPPPKTGATGIRGAEPVGRTIQIGDTTDPLSGLMGLSEQEIQQKIKGNRALWERCWKGVESGTPSVVVKVRVRKDGTVERVEATPPQGVQATTLCRCVETAVGRWRFPVKREASEFQFKLARVEGR